MKPKRLLLLSGVILFLIGSLAVSVASCDSDAKSEYFADMEVKGSSEKPEMMKKPIEITIEGEVYLPGAKEETSKDLKSVQPLPKVHYYWPVPVDLYKKVSTDVESSKLYQLARITHSVCFRGEKVTSEQFSKSVYICSEINKTEPDIPCSIGINFGPWHSWYPGLFDKDLPPTYRGKKYYAELKLFRDRLQKHKKWLAEYNRLFESSVQVTAILLDVERFKLKKNDSEWNNAMAELLDATHQTAAKVFPKARIEWYGRGIQWDKRTSSWTGKEKNIPSLSCSIYSLPMSSDMDRWFRKTCKLADQTGAKSVTPWVALASGYQYGRGKKLRWEQDWRYDSRYAYQMGRKLNSLTDQYYKRAEVIVFFPEPYDPDATLWEHHFIEYCKGAETANLDKDP